MRAWLLGATLYLPAAWAHDPARRAQARIPARVVFQEKWRLAVTLLRRVRAAGIHITAVVGDAEYGDNSTLRQALSRWRLPYAVGISGELTLFRGTPTVRPQPHAGPPGNRRGGWPTLGTMNGAMRREKLGQWLAPRRSLGTTWLSVSSGMVTKGSRVNRS